MIRYLLIFLMMVSTVQAEWFGPRSKNASENGVLSQDRTWVQLWRCQHNSSADSITFDVQALGTNDSIWGVIYSNSGNEPASLVGRTNEIHISGTGDIVLEFSGVSLSGGVVYYIGVEFRDGNATADSRCRRHLDTARAYMSFYVDDTATATWPTGSDATDNNGYQPYVRVYETPTTTYDTTTYTRTFTFQKSNYLEENGISGPWTNYGSSPYLLAGESGLLFSTCQPVMSSDDEAYVNSFLSDTMDILDECSLMIHLTDSSPSWNVTTDSTYWRPLATHSFHETQSNEDLYSTGNAWGGNGASSVNVDYFAVELGVFALGDTVDGEWYAMVADSSLNGYNNMIRHLDSSRYDHWSWVGYKGTPNSVNGNDYIRYTSDDGTEDPYLWLKGRMITAVASGDWTSDWHTSYDWNDVNQDWNSGP